MPEVAPVTRSANRGFDPPLDVTSAQLAPAAKLAHVNLRTLSPYHRALLVIDGTVTTFIEAWALEPLEIHRVAQASCALTMDDPWLDAPAGTEVIRREVVIEGRETGSLYAHALSLMIESRLPDAVRHRLSIDGEGIGRILNDNHLETRREILWSGRERAPDLPSWSMRAPGAEVLTRTYRIFHGGRPLAVICERFPAGIDRSPSHH